MAGKQFDYPRFIAKLKKLENNGSLYRAIAEGEDAEISYVIQKPEGWNISWNVLCSWSEFWYHIPISEKGKPLYEVTMTVKKCGYAGKQKIPSHAIVKTAWDALEIIGKKKDGKKFMKELEDIRVRAPELKKWFIQFYPRIRKEEFYPGCIYLAEYFKKEKNIDEVEYIREFSIEGVDTKFLEKHIFLAKTLWNTVFPEDKVENEDDLFSKLKGEDKDKPAVGVRILDDKLVHNGLRRFYLSYNDLKTFRPDAKRLIIVENKVNGYTFPEVLESIILFGAGYGIIRAAKEADWIREKEIWYWGDIDTDGLAILAGFRKEVKKTVYSFLMDRKTLEDCIQLKTTDTGVQRNMPENLTVEEKLLWEDIREKKIRLEQERIPREKVLENVKAIILR